MPNFFGGLANLATGGIYEKLGGDTGQTSLESKLAMLRDPDTLQRMAAYKPDIVGNVANLLTGGIYGKMTGMGEKQQMQKMAEDAILTDEIRKRAMQRAVAANLGPSPDMYADNNPFGQGMTNGNP